MRRALKKWRITPGARRGLRALNPADYILLLTTLALICLGLVSLYSSSAIWADTYHMDSAYFLKRQVFYLLIGGVLMYLFAVTDYNRLREWIKPAFITACLVLAAVLFTRPVAGVRRWIRLGPIGIQPSEFAKLVMLVYLADYLDRNNSRVVESGKALIPVLSVITLMLGLIGLAPDLGTPVLLFTVTMFVLYAAGARMKYLFTAMSAAVPVVAFELIRKPYRVKRLLTFLSPFEDAQGAGYQLVQSLLAVGSGGWFGNGIGSSRLKLMYLPAPHTDFIFPVICEELGLVGSMGILSLFTLLLVRGVRIAKGAPNLFGSILGLGITLLLSFQAFLNIAMAIGFLPTKGLPLPFFSYGGSSLLVSMAAVGILLNISTHKTRVV